MIRHIAYLFILLLPVAAGPLRSQQVARIAPTYADVSYGDHERHVLDYWRVEGATRRRWSFSFPAADFRLSARSGSMRNLSAAFWRRASRWRR